MKFWTFLHNFWIYTFVTFFGLGMKFDCLAFFMGWYYRANYFPLLNQLRFFSKSWTLILCDEHHNTCFTLMIFYKSSPIGSIVSILTFGFLICWITCLYRHWYCILCYDSYGSMLPTSQGSENWLRPKILLTCCCKLLSIFQFLALLVFCKTSCIKDVQIQYIIGTCATKYSHREDNW